MSPRRSAQTRAKPLVRVRALKDPGKRRQETSTLAAQLRFETLLAELSAAFVNVPADAVDGEIERWLRRIVEFLGLERSMLAQFSDEDGDFRITHAYAKAGFTPALAVIPRQEVPWHVEKMLAGEPVVLTRLDDIPAHAARDRETARRFGVKSAVMVPLRVSGTVIGAMTFDALRRQRSWPDDVVRRFRLVGEVFANALARKRSRVERDELLRFETLLSELSAAFVNVPADHVDAEIEGSLRRIVEFLGIDRGTLAQFPDDEGDFLITHWWVGPGLTPLGKIIPRQALPWLREQILGGRVVSFSRLDDLPPEAWRDKETYRQYGTKSNVVIPLMVAGSTIGAIGFGALRKERSWPEDLVKRLLLVGEVFANALARKRANAEREELLRFEDLVARLSAAFVNVPAYEVDKVIEEALRLTVEFLGVDRATVYEFSEDGTSYRAAHTFARPGIPRAPKIFPSDRFPWFAERMLKGETVALGRPGDLADEAQPERDYLAGAGIKAFAAVPLAAGGSILGAVGWAALRAGREWPEALVQRMRLVGEVFASVLARQRAEEALRRSEERFRLLLETTRAVPWEADATTWQFSYVGPQAADLLGYPIADWYQKDFWATHLHPDDREAAIASCMESSRTARDYSFEYRMVAADGRAVWIHDSVTVERAEGEPRTLRGFMLDISERKRLEQQFLRQREELAHVARVATMGELSAALAHELNQPLGAILSNAEAAELLLAADPPALDEVRVILADIAKDNRRAGEVIRRMRGLLRKGELEFQPQDLNELIRDVARLVGPEAHVRRVTVSLDLDPDLRPARGDRVHLQQVVLNLMLNGMETMGQLPPGDRTLVVHTREAGPQTVEAAVEDRGVGIPAGALSRIFDPFYTTKPGGMGMGLSIVRSIVEAHGGRVWAENNPQRGATVRFTLPAGDAEPA